MVGTLVIIDMQSGFGADKIPHTTAAILREIKAAKKNKWGIVTLEYDCHGQTIEPIKREIGRYRRFVSMEKSRDAGDREVLSAIADYSLPADSLRVCGINAAACVAQTIRGLKAAPLYREKIVAVADGINHLSDGWIGDFVQWEKDTQFHRMKVMEAIEGYGVDIDYALPTRLDYAAALVA